MLILPVDRDALRLQAQQAQPFPHFCIDNFLEPEFAESVMASFPSFQEAVRIGRSFSAVNEHNKVQITDVSRFPAPLRRLHEELSSPEWLETLSGIMGIPDLLADPALSGGGIHETGPRGHLDVHVDFNFLKNLQLHRRINILVYFNKDWRAEWGGNIELWDRDVKVCHKSLSPIFNRCVIFATSEISFHGVTAVRCPAGVSRKSFAAYYYTEQPPNHWDGQQHSTLFRARPDERMKRYLSMPLERIARSLHAVGTGLIRTARRKRS